MLPIPKSTTGKLLTIVILVLLLALALLDVLSTPGIREWVARIFNGKSHGPVAPAEKLSMALREATRGDGAFLGGESLELEILVNKKAHLLLFCKKADEPWHPAAPQGLDLPTVLRGGEPGRFKFPVGPPYGRWMYRVIVTTEAIQVGREHPLPPDWIDNLLARLKSRSKSEKGFQWLMEEIKIEALDPDA